MKTATLVAADTGIPARTIERWLGHDATPSIRAFARLVAAYGPGFLAACIPGLAWVERAAALADHDGLAAEIGRLEQRRAALVATLRTGRTGRS